MKIIDTCSLRNKKVEKMLRELDHHIDMVQVTPLPKKEVFMEIFMLTMELFIEGFRQMENNTTPAKTLLDYTGIEVRDACFRVGKSSVFQNDSDYVIAVMQELTK